jgi:hypothetical protein
MTEKMSDEEFRILNGVLRYDYGVTETQTASVKSAFAPPASGSSIIAQESPADAEPSHGNGTMSAETVRSIVPPDNSDPSKPAKWTRK